MILSTPIITVIKYTFLGLVVTGAGFLIANTAVTLRYKAMELVDELPVGDSETDNITMVVGDLNDEAPIFNGRDFNVTISEDIGMSTPPPGLSIIVTGMDVSEKMEHLPYKAQPSPRSVSLSLHKNSLLCLTRPSKPFCLMSAKKRQRLLKNRHFSSDAGRESGTVKSNHSIQTFRPLYLLMKDFVDFANDLEVAPMLLEPSILFCMLSTLQKYLLISNNLQTKILQGSPNIVTFGIFERESRILTQETSVNRSEALGFEFSKTREQLYQNGELVDTSISFTRQNLTVSVIVFFEREAFLWHPGSLGNESSPFLPMQFASSQVFENFTAVPFLLGDGLQSGFHLPSKVTHFLLQVQNSEFEDCLPLSTSEDISHPTLSRDQLMHRTLIAIQEMKSVLRPLLATFWLWNETLSGWEDSCDIFQKTSDFHIAVAVPVSADSKMDLNSMFMRNEYLHPVEYNTWDDLQLHLTLDCYGLRIRITVIYADHDSMWNYEEDTAGKLIKNNYPKLQLCSTSVLGQLVHRPCSIQTTR